MDYVPRAPEAGGGARRRPAVLAAVAYAGGLIVAALFPLPPWPLAGGTLVLAGAGAAFLRRPWATWLVLAALACGGAAWFTARARYLDPRDLVYQLPADYSPRRVAVVGVVADEPEHRAFGTACGLRLESWAAAGARRPGRGTARVSLPLGPDVRYGDRLALTGVAAAPRPSRNPNGFDYRAYLGRRGVTSQLRVARPADVRLLVRGRGNAVYAASFAVKRWAAAILRRDVGGEEGKLLNALTLGAREELDPAVVESFRAAGTAHLLAISGFNVGILAFLLFLVLEGTRLPRVVATLAALAFLPAFALMTGFNPPVVRATVMVMLVLLGKLVRRDADLFNLLAAAALVILIYNPLLLGDASFLLSFAATFALAAYYPFFTRAFRFLPPLVRETAAGTAAAQLGILPLQLYYFFRFSPVGLVSNVLMVPLASLATTLSLTTIVAGGIWPALGSLYGGAAWLVARALLLGGCYFAAGLAPLARAWPAAAAFLGSGPRLDLQLWLGRPAFAVLAGLTLLLVAPLVRGRARRLGVVTAAALTFGGWGLARLAAPPPPLRLTFLDVGQADAAVVELPGGRVLVVDAGYAGAGYDAGAAVVTPFLHGRGITRIDYLCVTHGDADHAGGAAYLVDNFDVGEVWAPARPGGRGEALTRLRAAAARRGVPYVAPPRQRRLGGVEVATLWPPAPLPAALAPNDASTVLRLRYGRFAALFTGDIETAGETGLLATGAPVGADVLKVPHHGAANAAYAPFVAAVNPRAAVLTTKAGSSRWPAPATLALYRRSGAAVAATHMHGAARLETDGRRLTLTTAY